MLNVNTVIGINSAMSRHSGNRKKDRISDASSVGRYRPSSFA